MTKKLATANDVSHLLGEVNDLVAAKILALAPTRDELDEAVRQEEDEMSLGEEPHHPSSPRVANLRRIIAEVRIDDDEEVAVP
ncbi:MAG: hypothetical protein ACKV2T_33205 [Kofleriaceae bacterium]